MTITIPGPGRRFRPLLAGLVSVAMGMLISPALASDQPGTSMPSLYPPEHTISVQGVGTVFIKPDLAEVSLGVNITRTKLSDARTDAASAMNAVIDALHQLGIGDADIETAYLNISPTWDYSSNVQRVTGYEVDNILQVRVHDLDKLGDVVDGAIAAGATTVNGITFDLSDPTSAQSQARAAAVKDARARADELASAAGVQITGVSSINETSYSMPWPIYADASRGVVAPEQAPTPVIPGNSQVTVNVSVVYTIG
jgi:uncharacterized protein YggE